MKKKGRWLVFLLVLMLGSVTNVYAASLSISASSTSVTNGGSVKVTVKASGLAGKFSVTTSNSGVLSGGTSSVWLEDESKTYTFSAKSVGSSTITVKALDVADSSGNSYTASKSVTIKVVKPREKSTNNDLKSLSVDGYQISPAFNKNTLEYTVNLESSVESIKINATKEDGYASLSGTGEKDVVEGDNKFELTVTSETGSKKVYTLNAIVQDSNPISAVVDGKSYTVVKRASVLVKPEEFEEGEVVIDEVSIPAFTNETVGITLVGLKDSDGKTNLFKYEDGNYTSFITLASLDKTIIVEEEDLDIKYFTKKDVVIDDATVQAYVSDFDSNYVVVKGINLATGNEDLYIYDIQGNMIINYMESVFDGLDNDFNQLLTQYKYVILGLSGLAVFLLLVIIIQIASKNRLKKKMRNKMKAMMQKVEEQPKKEKEKELPKEEVQVKKPEVKEIPKKTRSNKKKSS